MGVRYIHEDRAAEDVAAAVKAEREACAKDHAAVMDGHRRLVRELDIALNGEASAAKQSSLCDIVAQVKDGRWKLVQTQS